MAFNHIPVLLHETVDSLNIIPDGIYADCTAGGGSHSAEILSHLSPEGKLICIDRDPTAIAHLKEKFAGCPNVTVVHDNFTNIKDIKESLGIDGFDGIIADLGLSSVQIDTPERGFSYLTDAPLDMRMSQVGPTAADFLNTAGEQEIARVLFQYGEEKFSRSIARRIVAKRQTKPIETTFEFAEIIRESIPAKARREGGNPCKRSFQAVRCFINSELTDLPSAIDSMFESLKPGGTLSIITFQSLEDRIVKNAFRNYLSGCTCPPDFPVCVCNKKPRAEQKFKSVTPGEKELELNPRSHSARLRSVCKTNP